jgi:hypothetical protein
MPSKKNSRCRYCDSTRLTRFLSLGEQPPSNSFLRSDQIIREEKYPLDVYFCESCFLVQLLEVVSPDILFGEYLYLASSSKALKTHYARLANLLVERFAPTSGSVVVDIGCNDGILLHGYSRNDLVKVGVEPSSVAAVAAESGLAVMKTFFGSATAARIVATYGPAKLITATNVFPHVNDIASFTRAVESLLAGDGVFVIEASYLIDLIEQTLFDTIYHEHLCYLSLTPMIPFFRRHGLEIFDVERVPFGASGPALRVFAQKQSAGRPVSATVPEMLAEEERWGVASIHRYFGYARQVETIKHSNLAILSVLRGLGKRIGAFGAPAKGNTLLNYFGLSNIHIDCIAENNPLKLGTLTPGSHIEVVSDEEFLSRMPDYALLLSWNYLEFFLENSEYIRRGGRFLVPIPVPSIQPPLQEAP